MNLLTIEEHAQNVLEITESLKAYRSQIHRLEEQLTAAKAGVVELEERLNKSLESSAKVQVAYLNYRNGKKKTRSFEEAKDILEAFMYENPGRRFTSKDLISALSQLTPTMIKRVLRESNEVKNIGNGANRRYFIGCKIEGN